VHQVCCSVAVVALVALTSVSLTGCTTATATVTTTVTATTSSGTSNPSTSTPTSRAAASSTPTATSATSSTQPATRTDPSAPRGQCPDSALRVSVQNDPEGSGAGQRAAFVVFENTGRTACRLEGTPGLSLVGGGHGTQIGTPATRSTTGAKLVDIAPKHYALAPVQYTYVDKNGGNFSTGNGHDPDCRAKPADGYRVYPPHSYRAYFTRNSTYACSTTIRWVSVGPVMPSSRAQSFTPKF